MKIFMVDDDAAARMIAVEYLRIPFYDGREMGNGAALI